MQTVVEEIYETGPTGIPVAQQINFSRNVYIEHEVL